MKFIQRLTLALAMLIGAVVSPAWADDTDPLFINLTTDDAHRASMGLTFGLHQQQNGHPVTIFLNDRGVLLGSRARADQYAELQRTLDELMKNGATVLVVALSMKHHRVREDELLPGLKVSNRKLSGDALFKDNTKSLTW